MFMIPKIELRLKEEPCIVDYDEYDIKIDENKIKFGRYKVPKDKIIKSKLDDFTKLRALSSYLSMRLQQHFARSRGFFVDYSNPLSEFNFPWDVLELKLTVYRGFKLEWYVVDRHGYRYRLHLIPRYEFFLEPRLDIILKTLIEKGMSLTVLENVNLSTERTYWEKKLGPKDAGVFDSICTKETDTRVCDYHKILNSIKQYFENKSKRRNQPEIKMFFEEKLKEDSEPIIVRTWKLWKGEESMLYFISSMLYITPSLESLNNLLDFLPEEIIRSYLDAIHKTMRPDANEYVKRLNKLKEKIIEIFSQVRFIKVEGA